MIWIGILIGFVVGANFGVITMALFAASKDKR